MYCELSNSELNNVFGGEFVKSAVIATGCFLLTCTAIAAGVLCACYVEGGKGLEGGAKKIGAKIADNFGLLDEKDKENIFCERVGRGFDSLKSRYFS